MAIPKLFTLARMTTVTAGTGTITLGGAATVNGVTYLSFAAAGVADGDIVAYGIADTNASEYGYGTYTASGTTLTRNVIRSTNSNTAISLSGSANVFITAGNAELIWGFDTARNLGISATVGASALTIALKGWDGADPSANNPVLIAFRSATAATGTPVLQAARAAASLVVSSGSTLGTTNGAAFRLVVGIFDDGGTLRVGVINPTQMGIDEGAVATSTTEGGAGGADSANTWYTGTGATSKAFRAIGYLDYPSGLATAGTWSAAPTTIQLDGPAIRIQPAPFVTAYTSGSGTYTTPAGTISLQVELVGGGGGGAGSGATAGNGSDGGNTTFGTLTGNKGTGGTTAARGVGGTGSGGDLNLTGGSGSNASGTTANPGGDGGTSFFGGTGTGFMGTGGGAGNDAATNSGSGGGGAGDGPSANSGGSGGAGGYVRKLFALPAATYSYAVGAGGAGGSAGTSGGAGGAGAAGVIIVTAYFE